ncbi:hypothetical protein [Actinopolymorpha alba]|uniref:hypothetical protein n=1 Tax=Actinopolymorpha alba TaxID=533267 RepID=UPI000369C90F|nr:hypothetical protein [Actinopolymorpha alba]
MRLLPFLDDVSPRDERRGLVWAAFATVAGQVERVVMANVVWAFQLAPGLAALAFPELPGWLRILLGLYSATALPPATAVLYGLAAQACRGQHVDAGLAVELFRAMAARSLRILAPLYGTFGVLGWLAVAAGGIGPLATVLTLAILGWSVCATYWGPIFAAEPGRSFAGIARESVRLAWRHPERTLLIWVVAGLAVLVGVVSVGGLVLIVPALVSILQTHLYEAARTSPPRT